ncbi:MAG: hypothetical protein O3A20_01985 [Planctomycetota bacterium]|nr:hypothetical protein [Planctomycetota bacterium]
MLALLLPLLAAPAAPSLQEPPPPVGEVQEITPAEAATAIADAVRGKDAALAEGVIRLHGHLADAAVVKEIGAALKHAELAVRLAAVEALRFNTHEAATDLLIKQKSNKKLLEDPVTGEAFAYALGQKRDQRAIPLLKDGLTSTGNTNNKVMSAKIYALGRIRDKESCEELMSFLNSAALKTDKYIGEVRTSMAVLTGVDVGKSRKDWLDWWRDNKSKLKIIAEEPPLPEGMGALNWKRLWATPEEIEAWKKERRGGEEGAEDGDGGAGGDKRPPKRERPPPGGGDQ